MRMMQSRKLEQLLADVPEDQKDAWMAGYRAAAEVLSIGGPYLDGSKFASFAVGALETFLEESESGVQEE